MPICRLERPQPLGEQLANSLRFAIVTGELPAGERLVEARVAGQFGVSRTLVREALAQLNAEGLVCGGSRGYVVLGMSEDDIAEVYGLRQNLESLAVSLAVDHATAADDERLASLVEEMRDAATAGDGTAFASLDIEFHSVFYQLARHRRLLNAWNNLSPSVALLLQVSNAADRDLNVPAQAHAALVDAFVTRDLQRLESELSSHLTHAAELVANARCAREGTP